MNGSLRYKAREIIKTKITDFEIKPGKVLYVGTIARELITGRPPVRDALLILEQEKLFVGILNVGYMVHKHSRKELQTITRYG